MKIRFDNIDIASNLLDETSFQEAVETRIEFKIEASNNCTEKIVSSEVHPFIYAIYRAFSEHRPLILSPDIVWLVICQGVSEHINENAEEYRSMIVPHAGRKRITIRNDTLVKGSSTNPWGDVIKEFSKKVQENTTESFFNSIDAEFSTTGEVEKIAFQITTMSAVKKYFEYVCGTLCGIPEITIIGNKKDWVEILDKFQNLSSYGLDWWVRKLSPILKKIIQTMDGKVDYKFWRGIFKYIPENEDSGSVEKINGWCIQFFPYLVDIEYDEDFEDYNEDVGEVLLWRNPFLGRRPSNRYGCEFNHLPSGLVKVDFTWEYLGSSYPMEFYSGFVGIKQDHQTKALTPSIGWAVRDKAS